MDLFVVKRKNKKKTITPTVKCSDYPGYECLSSSDCESGTSKGLLNCSGGKVCCKMQEEKYCCRRPESGVKDVVLVILVFW